MTLSARLSTWVLGLFGWRVLTTPPPAQKGVVIIYPHTSNWDFVLGVMARAVLQLRMHWVGKHTLFRWPFESIMRAFGGVPVDRAHTHGFVGQMEKEYERYAQFFVVITPEGTRARTPHWKSGFYHLAVGMKLPLGLACIDYANREVGMMEWFYLSGNIEQDMHHIREAYRGRHGKNPKLEGEIRFRE